MTPESLVVVGAGAAGLGAAYALRSRGLMPLLIEAEGRAGGKVGTDAGDGFVTERAALALLDRTGDLARLARELGLSPLEASAAARERYVERDGHVHALPRGPKDLVRTKMLTTGEKLSLLGEPFRRRSPPDASVAQFFARRLETPGAFLADALQTGIYAGDPEALEMASSFPQLFELEQRHGSLVRGLVATSRGGSRARLSSFPRGLQELMDALARAIGPGLRLGARLLSVAKDGAVFRLRVDGRSGRAELSADRLLLALPAPQAAEVLASLDSRLSDCLRGLQAAPISLVHLALRPEDVGPVQHGFGILRPRRPVVGALFPAALFPGRAPAGRVLLSALVGGARFPAHAGRPDGDLVELVRAELKLPAAPNLVRVVRWPQAIPQYVRGHAARIAEIEALTAAHPGLALAGAWYRGVSVLDCLRDGARAAERLLS